MSLAALSLFAQEAPDLAPTQVASTSGRRRDGDAHGRGRRPLGEELLAPLRVGALRDDRVRHGEDRRVRAVVLLELDDARALEVLLEVEDVAHVGAAPAVDGLVVVADGADVAPRAAEEPQHLELGAVGVLVLVDEDVQELALPARAHVLALAPEARDLAHEVVEVERAVLLQRRLVARVDDAGDLVVGVAFALGEIVGREERVLRVRDPREHGGGVVRAVGPGVAQELLHERGLVALVEDGEAPADRLALAPEDVEAERVERRDRGAARVAVARRAALAPRRCPRDERARRARASRRRPCW